MSYPVEKKNQILSRILAREIGISEASRTYGIGRSTINHWLRTLSKTNGEIRRSPQNEIPLPRNMTFREAISADGYCRVVGLDSSQAGEFCRTRGISLEEMKQFNQWLTENDEVLPGAPFRLREKELIETVTELSATNKANEKEIRRKEKALAEAAALLILSKKAEAIWGDKEN